MNTVFITIGAPGSGKSTFSKSMAPVCVVSSDALRTELFGTLKKQDPDSHNIIFKEMNVRLLKGLQNGDVVYDATNLNRKRRANFKREVLKKNGAHVKALIFTEPLKVLLARNSKRPEEQRVPEDKIKQMYINLNIPKLGLDCDTYAVMSKHSFFKKPMKYENLLRLNTVQELYELMADEYKDEIKNIFGPHDTPYHLEDIDEHINMCISNANDDVSHIVALFHDLGKSITKEGGRYFGHQNVSAMYAMLAFQEICGMKNAGLILETIYQHMQAHQGISNKVIKRYNITDDELEAISTFNVIDDESRITDGEQV